MRRILTAAGLGLLSFLCIGLEARAGSSGFETSSTATQTISSALGDFVTTASGLQTFTIDTSSGTADVVSDFQGTVPGVGIPYNEYNTTTAGTVTTTGSGTYDISFPLLFEVDFGGPLTGLDLVTNVPAIFESSNVPTIPFPSNTAFADPSGSDTVNLYVLNDVTTPFGSFTAGEFFGTSSHRIVTVVAVIPEPSSVILLGFGAAGLVPV